MNQPQKKFLSITIIAVVGVLVINSLLGFYLLSKQKKPTPKPTEKYWFILHRKSNKEELFRGLAGDKDKSTQVKTFQVKVGIPGERPTPLPKLLNKEYWLITEKHEEKDNPETGPYFLTLNIPAPSEEPYGPVPYKECNGEQCNWVRQGAFGLHGINGDPSLLSASDPGSSGCIRHKDEDITYLFKTLDTSKEIRYYIEDN